MMQLCFSEKDSCQKNCGTKEEDNQTKDLLETFVIETVTLLSSTSKCILFRYLGQYYIHCCIAIVQIVQNFVRINKKVRSTIGFIFLPKVCLVTNSQEGQSVLVRLIRISVCLY